MERERERKGEKEKWRDLTFRERQIDKVGEGEKERKGEKERRRERNREI